MGFFGHFTFIDGQWTDNESVEVNAPFLRIVVHDSDIAQVDYAPVDSGRGRFYLGYEPAVYFEDPNASEQVDADTETRGFSAWVDQVVGARVSSESLLPLLAHADGTDPDGVFVEDTVRTLLDLAGLPRPAALD